MSNNSRINNWIFQNNAVALGDGNILLISAGMMTLTIEITGSGTNTVIFEGRSTEGSTYYPIAGVNLADFTVATSTSNKGCIYQLSLEGLTAFRVRVSALTSGTVSVSGTVVN